MPRLQRLRGQLGAAPSQPCCGGAAQRELQRKADRQPLVAWMAAPSAVAPRKSARRAIIRQRHLQGDFCCCEISGPLLQFGADLKSYWACPASEQQLHHLLLRRSLSYGPRPCDVTPPIIQWIPPLIHWDLTNLDQQGGDSASTEPSSELRPVVAVVETGASTDSQVSAAVLPAPTMIKAHACGMKAYAQRTCSPLCCLSWSEHLPACMGVAWCGDGMDGVCL